MSKLLHRRFLGCLAILTAAAPWATASAATYSVGSSAGCTHGTLQAALDAAAANPSGPHLIKLTTGTLGVPDGLTLHNPAANVRIVGGHASCTAAAPTAGARTVIDAAGGRDGTVFDIRQGSSPWREVHLERLDITGGTGETGIGASSEGGGLELRGNLEVYLNHGTRVLGNRANRAAGVLMQGGPGLVGLRLRGGSQIRNNTAETDGGGVWCWADGLVDANDSSISFNEAGRDGGGVWLNSGCALRLTASDGQVADMNGNRAGTRFNAVGQGRGGAVYLRSSRQLVAAGDEVSIGASALSPGAVFMVGNEALGAGTESGVGAGGSALYLEGSGSERIRVRLTDAVLSNNVTASSIGPAAVSVNRAIDFTMEGRPGRCDGSFGFGLCSAIAASTGPAIDVNGLGGSTETVAPVVTVRRTRVTGGGPVLREGVLENPHARISFNSIVVDGNTGPYLFLARSQLSLTFSTVAGNQVGNVGVVALLPATGRTLPLDLTGALLWQPAANLLHFGGGGSAQITHNGCLLAHSNIGLPTPSTVRTGAPLLGSDWTPQPGSPALDVCDRFFGLGMVDAYGQSRPVDQPTVPNFLGAHDLGAIERPLSALPVEIFRNGFE